MGWAFHWWVVHMYLTRMWSLPWNLSQLNMANKYFWKGVLQVQIHHTTFYFCQRNSQSISWFHTCNLRVPNMKRDAHMKALMKMQDLFEPQHSLPATLANLSTKSCQPPRMRFTEKRPHLVNYDTDPRVSIKPPNAHDSHETQVDCYTPTQLPTTSRGYHWNVPSHRKRHQRYSPWHKDCFACKGPLVKTNTWQLCIQGCCPTMQAC